MASSTEGIAKAGPLKEGSFKEGTLKQEPWRPSLDVLLPASSTTSARLLHKHKCRVEQVREDYLRTSGVTHAVRTALKQLFSEPKLPANPYYFLSKALGAYVDQSPLWKEQQDVEIVTPYDREGSIQVLVADTHLCAPTASSVCFGLPHVVRLVSKDGASILHEVCTSGLPDTFFPAPSPFATSDGCTVQLLSSIQGMCALWRPSRTDMPELEVRTDVIIQATDPSKAVAVFLDVVQTAMEDLADVPVYFADGMTIMDGPATSYEGHKRPFSVFYSMEQILMQPKEFERDASRLVLDGKCIRMRCVLLLDGALMSGGRDGRGGASTFSEESLAAAATVLRQATAGLDGTAGQADQTPLEELRYHTAVNTYFFHYKGMKEKKVGYDQMQHYGTLPYDALYQGYFTSLAAVQSYIGMYRELDRPNNDDKPYGVNYLPPNTESLKRQVIHSFHQGDSLKAFQQLLHLIMLKDQRVTFAPILEASMIEELAVLVTGEVYGRTGRVDKVRQRRTLYASVPNILRILSSAAATIQSVALELEAISIVITAWPAKLQLIKRMAVVEGGRSEYRLRPDGLYTSPNTGDSRRTLRTPEVSNAMLTWLRTFDMEHHLLGELDTLKPRTIAVIGNGLFSGVSILSELLLSYVPSPTPRTRKTEHLTRLQPVLVQLLQLLKMGSLNVTQGFLGRCQDVRRVLELMGVDTEQLGMDIDSVGDYIREPGQVEPDGGEVPQPEYELDVPSVVDSQVRSGAIAERVGAEGVMLQYAVDAKLDEALSALWLTVSRPPQSLNPFPKLMHIIRSRAAKMELWREELDEALGLLLNELSAARAGGSAPMYAGQASSVLSQQRRWRHGRQAGNQVAGDFAGEERVYGSYAAVMMADAHALQTLAAELPTLLTGYDWHQGAYRGEVLISLMGDAMLTNTFDLDDAPLATGPGGVLKVSVGASCPCDHPRFFCVMSEATHLVQGPKRREAVLAFATQLVRSLRCLLTDSPHMLRRVSLWLPKGDATLQEVQRVQAERAATSSQQSIPLPSTPGTASSSRSRSRPDTPRTAAAAVAAAAFLADPLPVIGQRLSPVPVGEDGMSLEAVEFGVVDLVDEARSMLVMRALTAAAQAVPQGQPLGSIQVYAAAQNTASYVSFKQALVFQHTKQPPPLLANQATAAALLGGSPLPPRPSTADQRKQYWDRGVYQRVFLTEAAAVTWWSWNRERGDPAQPLHQQHLLAELAGLVRWLLARGQVLEAHKAALLGAVALQDDVGVYELSRSCRSAAQELSVLQEVNHTLVDLMGPGGTDPKMDNGRLRRMLLSYCTRTQRALSSPRTCYFLGLSALSATVLDALKDHVLSSFELGPRQLAQLDQLAVWTHACEISVTSALHDSFHEDVRARWLAGAGPGSSRHQTGSSAASPVLRPVTPQQPQQGKAASTGAGQTKGLQPHAQRMQLVMPQNNEVFLSGLADE